MTLLSTASHISFNAPLAWHLMWDFHTLQQLIDTLPGNTSLQNKALYIANEIMNTFQGGSPTDIQRCRRLVEEVFGKGWAAKGADIYKEGEQKVQIIGCGNCHVSIMALSTGLLLTYVQIDTAWLWPYRVTQQKVARSWSTQVDLMERYPEHRFVASQAQQFKWLEQVSSSRCACPFPPSDRALSSNIPNCSTKSRLKSSPANSTPSAGLGWRTMRTCHLVRHSRAR